jgi:hypothetical protein
MFECCRSNLQARLSIALIDLLIAAVKSVYLLLVVEWLLFD